MTTTYASIIVGLSNGVTTDTHSNGSWAPKTTGASPLNLVAVGDGAGGLPGATAVGNLVTGMNPNMLLYLGDVYNSGTYGEFFNYYGPTLGSLYDKTNPVPGNHESAGGFQGYLDYWNTNKHYYSFDSGGWHFIALDSTSQFDQTAPAPLNTIGSFRICRPTRTIPAPSPFFTIPGLDWIPPLAIRTCRICGRCLPLTAWTWCLMATNTITSAGNQ